MPRILTGIQRTGRLHLGILLLALALLPQVGWAQLFQSLNLDKFKDGSYVLENDRTMRHFAQIKLLDDAKLVVKKEHGKNLVIWPGEVHSVRLDGKKYVKVEDFYVRGSIGRSYVEIGFAEQLDSGQVVLLRYEYSMGAGNPTYGAVLLSAYLLSRPTDATVTVAQEGNFSGAGKKFQEAVRPYLAGRPDLLQLLDERRIRADDLPAVVHALNTNLPFTP